uniref:Phospholipase A(2) n=1 Tax=Parastrongyloides trichosuri TaxID=131310 RepID=A0A0N4Z1T7_PARTI
MENVLGQDVIKTPYDDPNAKTIDFLCDKTFFDECVLVLTECYNEVDKEFQAFPSNTNNKNRQLYFCETCEASFGQCLRSKYFGFCNIYYQLTQYIPIYVRSILKRIEM